MITSDDIKMAFVRLPIVSMVRHDLSQTIMRCVVCGYEERHTFFFEEHWSHTVTDCMSNMYQAMQGDSLDD